MNALKRFSTSQSVAFGFVITLLVLVFYILAGIASALFGKTLSGGQIIEAAGRTTGAAILLILLWRFGWLQSAGAAQLGAPAVWGIAFIILAYEVATHVLPISGAAELGTLQPGEAAAAALNALATGPLEEIAFRGIILFAFISVWGSSQKGIMKSVCVSALLFGASHLVHILFGRPLPQAVLVALNTALGGIYYAVIVLRWRSVWPAAAIHGLLNAIVAMIAYSTPGFEESVPALALAVVSQIPLAVLGIWLLSKNALISESA